MSPLSITYRRPHELAPAPRNARTHTKKQIRQIADSIERFGFTNPVLLDGEDRVLAGHARIEAAKLLKIDEVPTIRLADMGETERRAYVIADNRLAELAGWDGALLALEFQYIAELDLDFDLTVVGFETAEIDLIIGEAQDQLAEEEVKVVSPDRSLPSVAQAGDLWCLGEHRLLCGDATTSEAFERLMGGREAQMVLTDPPYNVPIAGHVGGSGAIRHEAFAMAAGEMSGAEFTAFLQTTLGHMARHSVDGSIHFVFMDWRHALAILTAGCDVYDELKALVVWNKTNAGMGSFYRSKHELIFVFKRGGAPHINNMRLGAHGRNRTNVWDYPGLNATGEGRLDDLAMHPTVKPVALLADAMQDCSKRGGLILDGFAGSGSTIIAAEQTGRVAYALELDPYYVDTAIKRWQEAIDGQAVHAETGRTFEAMAAERDGREAIRRAAAASTATTEARHG